MFKDFPTPGGAEISKSAFNDNLFDYKKFLAKLAQYWWLFVISLPICLALGFLHHKRTMPYYQVSGRVIIQDLQGSSASDNLLLRQLSMDQSAKSLEKEIFQLRSEALMTQVSKDLDLNIRYFYEGKFRDSEYYRTTPIRLIPINKDEVTFGLVWIKSDGKGNFSAHQNNNSEITSGVTQDTLTLGYAKFLVDLVNPAFQGEIRVELATHEGSAAALLNALNIMIDNQNAGTLRLSMLDPVPSRAVEVINSLVDNYNENEINKKKLVFENTSRFINERLEKINRELDSTETSVVLFQQQNQVIVPTDGLGQALQQKQSSSETVTKLQNDINTLASIKKILADKGDGRYRLLPGNLTSVEDGVITSIISQYNELILKRNKFLGNASVESPAVVRVTYQIDNLKNSVALSVDEAERMLQTQYSIAVKNQMNAQSQIYKAPTQQKEFRSISRQQELKEKLFIYLLQKREEAEITKQTYQPSVLFISKTRPQGIQNVNFTKTMGIAGVIGFLIPMLFIYIAQLFDNKVRVIEDIKKITSISILGGIPHLDKSKTNIFINDFDVIESRNMIREKINYMLPNTPGLGSVMMVTSTIPGEGKSLITTNITATFAHTNKRLIVIGADLRNPSLSQFFKENNHKGLSSYLSGIESDYKPLLHKITLDDQTGGSASFDALFGGVVPPNPSQLIGSPRLAELIEQLRKDYDYIIIDTPPVGIVSDGFSIAKLVDTCIYVVRANKLDKQALKLVNEFEHEKRLTNIGIVLNDISRGGGFRGYGYGYNYGYGYGYGRSYGQGNYVHYYNNTKK
ncbi:MAG: polysaccharide biosynthesis tyrosine autokinase [Bacteroidales bacterium]|nr:polysaccharide biosynthesis tyrosine autokinase [Bacteroidales bacterium]